MEWHQECPCSIPPRRRLEKIWNLEPPLPALSSLDQPRFFSGPVIGPSSPSRQSDSQSPKRTPTPCCISFASRRVRSGCQRTSSRPRVRHAQTASAPCLPFSGTHHNHTLAKSKPPIHGTLASAGPAAENGNHRVLEMDRGKRFHWGMNPRLQTAAPGPPINRKCRRQGPAQDSGQHLLPPPSFHPPRSKGSVYVFYTFGGCLGMSVHYSSPLCQQRGLTRLTTSKL